MLALSLTFPAGRYHATPWDRHVNEGAVAWPPEPWRLLRALIATWHHKVKRSGQHQESTMLALIESLGQELPQYSLPRASHSHTRHYMPQWKVSDTSLVFDAFTAVARDKPLFITWPTVDLPDSQAALLDELLAVIGYLGRAESWVEASRVSARADPDCVPGDQPVDRNTGELAGEIVTMLAPLPPSEYRALRERFLADKRTDIELSATLPKTLFGALSVETADLRKQGWSQPPAARTVSYLRPLDALRPKRDPRREKLPAITTVRYLLVGKLLPQVEDSVRIGETLRRAVLARVGRTLGKDAISPMLSGHDLPDDHRHQHAFYLPWDANGDGRIDRLLLHVPAGVGVPERRILETLRRIWSRDGEEWQLVLEGIGDAGIGGLLTACVTEWQSLTPYLHPWHVKRGFSIEDQIRRECRERGLPEPIAFERLTGIIVGDRARRPIHFRRFRSKRGLSQPDRQGSFWRLRFAEPIVGPLALGFACHFGLGLFKSVSNE